MTVMNLSRACAWSA